jgi:stage II sporulation protein AA (anti-sigma F factor antagonist)
MPGFGVTSRHADGRLLVVPTGEIDIATVDAVRAELATREPGEAVVLDLRGVDFLDTSGIQVAVEVWRAARAEDYELRILRASPQVHRVFEIAGLGDVLPFADGDA